jgi:hypothetical protein
MTQGKVNVYSSTLSYSQNQGSYRQDLDKEERGNLRSIM